MLAKEIAFLIGLVLASLVIKKIFMDQQENLSGSDWKNSFLGVYPWDGWPY